jgi:5-methylcytosine-specific restriction endonuclease McrA
MHYKRQRNGADMNAPAQGTQAACVLPDCSDPHGAGGYCYRHYQRLIRTGDPYGLRQGPPTETCTLPDCDQPHNGNGLCKTHYDLSRRYGNTAGDKPCRRCGAAFRTTAEHPSYVYCKPCWHGIPAWYRKVRDDRRAANNASMTGQDWADTEAYRAIIAGDPCVYCGAVSTAVDHIVPVLDGGDDRWTNLAPICKRCNSIKRHRSVLVMMAVRRDRRPAVRGGSAGHVPQTDPLHI